MYILIKGEWNPRQYNCWEDPHKSQWAIVNWSLWPDIVAAEITKSYFNKDLRRAAEHYNGKGMEHGIDSDFTFKYLRNLKDETDSDLQYKAALETIISASTWPSARVHEAYEHVAPSCTRCNKAIIDTALHCFWTCPCNADIDHENVSESQSLIEQAVREADEYPCMWLKDFTFQVHKNRSY